MVLPAHIAASLAGTWLFLNQTSLPTIPLGSRPFGQIIYDARGYMSASMTSTDPEDIPTRSPSNATTDDFALIAQRILAYAGELHVEWENSTATEGRLIHGPLSMATRWDWLGQNQSRNYLLTRNASETGGRDVLHLWVRGEKAIGRLWWVRADST
ncbi:hypothetical protein IQ06DRAFT_315399 [Phaeosphaeriaceae sp. SRC1lsM3a]|nr:hypothetical protein IQ06DRAFT_315399 [Stagonospora sp. SRC1lsM3a]